MAELLSSTTVDEEDEEDAIINDSLAFSRLSPDSLGVPSRDASQSQMTQQLLLSPSPTTVEAHSRDENYRISDVSVEFCRSQLDAHGNRLCVVLCRALLLAPLTALDSPQSSARFTRQPIPTSLAALSAVPLSVNSPFQCASFFSLASILSSANACCAYADYVAMCQRMRAACRYKDPRLLHIRPDGEGRLGFTMAGGLTGAGVPQHKRGLFVIKVHLSSCFFFLSVFQFFQIVFSFARVFSLCAGEAIIICVDSVRTHPCMRAVHIAT